MGGPDWEKQLAAAAAYREKNLAKRPVRSIVRSIGALSLRWLEKDYFYRKKAVERLVKESRLTDRAAEAVLDSIFSELVEKKIWKLLRAELKDPSALDRFRRDAADGRFCRARGPAMIAHVFAGNVPNPAVLSFIFGMLVKSVNVGKASSRDGGFLDIYLESLAAADRRLARTNFLIGAGDSKSLRWILGRADLVVAYGRDETLEELKRHVPAATPFFAYGHRVSFAVCTRRARAAGSARRLAERAARDVWMLDQRGCLSPLVIYAERGGGFSPFHFAELLAESLGRFSKSQGSTPPSFFSRIAAHEVLKNQCRTRRLAGERVRAWFSREKGRWAVIYDERPDLMPALAGDQIVYVKAFGDARRLFSLFGSFGRHLQCVAVEGTASERKRLAERLSDLGVNRVTRMGRMQDPPLTWHHDGGFNLASWVKWTDLEM